MPEDAAEGCLGPPELERKQAEADDYERNAGAGEHKQCKTTEERREPSERHERPNNGRAAPVSLPPLAQAVARSHATAAGNSSPSLRSR